MNILWIGILSIEPFRIKFYTKLRNCVPFPSSRSFTIILFSSFIFESFVRKLENIFRKWTFCGSEFYRLNGSIKFYETKKLCAFVTELVLFRFFPIVVPRKLFFLLERLVFQLFLENIFRKWIFCGPEFYSTVIVY